MTKPEHSQEYSVTVLIGQFTVTAAEPWEHPSCPAPFDIIDMGSIGIAECTADVSEVGSAKVN